MREVKAIIKRDRLDEIVRALRQIPDMPGLTVSVVHGFGRAQPGRPTDEADHAEFAKLETVVRAALVKRVTEVIRTVAHTGRPSDGKIFVFPVEAVTRISSGEEGEEAI